MRIARSVIIVRIRHDDLYAGHAELTWAEMKGALPADAPDVFVSLRLAQEVDFKPTALGSSKLSDDSGQVTASSQAFRSDWYG